MILMQSPCFLRDNDPQRSGRFPVLIRVAAMFLTHTQDIHRPDGSMYAYWPEFMSTGCHFIMAVSMQRLFQPDMMIRQFSNEILQWDSLQWGGYHLIQTLYNKTWWCHQMETFSALLAICAGNSPVNDEFPAHRPVTRSFDVFFHLHLNKRLSKQSWGWWFETLSRPLWRHCNETFMIKCSTYNLLYVSLPLIPLIYVGKYL